MECYRRLFYLIIILVLSFAVETNAIASVVINEIFYNAPHDLDDLEYVELLNAGKQTVNIGGWKLSKGVKFTFPQGARLEPGGMIVVAKNGRLLKEFYDVEAIGEFKKSLSNSGDRIELSDSTGKEIETVEYSDRVPWPKAADGYSASLERVCPLAPATSATNWAASRLSADYDRLPAGSPGKPNTVFADIAPPEMGAVSWKPLQPTPGSSLTITVQPKEPELMKQIAVHYQLVAPGAINDEVSVTMSRQENGEFVARIPVGEDANRLLRFRIKAVDNHGGRASVPRTNDLRPTFTAYVADSIQSDRIPVIQFFHVGQTAFEGGEQYRQRQESNRSGGRGFRGFGGPREQSPEDRLRASTRRRLDEFDLSLPWSKLTLSSPRSSEQLKKLAVAFRFADEELKKTRAESLSAASIEDFSKSLPEKLEAIRALLVKGTASILNKEEVSVLEQIGANADLGRDRRRTRRPDFSSLLQRVFQVERSWFRVSLDSKLEDQQLEQLTVIHRKALKDRASISAVDEDGRPNVRGLFDEGRALSSALDEAVAKILPAASQRPESGVARVREGRGAGRFDRGRRGGDGFRSRRGRSTALPLLPQGESAIVYTDPKTGKSEVFDFVNITERKSGWKVRFHKDRLLNGMSTLNFLYESDEATILNEALAYELYRQAGNASYRTGYMRVVVNGKPAGYHLFFEQPNGNFFRHNKIDDRGDLYKIIWMGNAEISDRIPEDERPKRMDIARRHEKKTNPHQGYQDLIALIEKLEQANSDPETWTLIEKNFDLDNVLTYFAVNSLLSHWDGYFNNYFTYFDRKGTGKWSMFPWDQDSTWSQRGGRADELYNMPLFFGAEGATPDGIDPSAKERRVNESRDRRDSPFGRGFGGGGFGGRGGGRRGGFGWWRPGGDFSRPLLANPEFYKRYLVRLNEITESVFTDEVFGPKIEEVHRSLVPEVRLLARMRGTNESQAVEQLQRTTNALREHLISRRKFVRDEVQKELAKL